MFKLINGFTKESVMAQVKKYNNDRKAVKPDGSCIYLTSDGNRCAIGCFIPDGHKALESRFEVEEIMYIFPDLARYMPFDIMDGLRDFQIAHDLCGSKSVYDRVQNFLNDQVE